MATRSVWGRFFKSALVWFVPALLILPIYLVLVAISAIGGDGALLEATDGVKGGINAALGPLLIAIGVAGVAAIAAMATDLDDGTINLGFAALVSLGLGVALSHKALAHLGKTRA